MRFQDLLQQAGIAERDVAICLHKPGDTVTRRALAIMVEERPELFEAYQSTHGAGPEATVRTRGFFASFLAETSGEATFLGLYTREIGPVLSEKDWLDDPVRHEVLSRVDGHLAPVGKRARALAGRILFRLVRLPDFAPFERRLVVRDPGGRNYVRLAVTTPLEVLELRRTARVSPPMPGWRDLVLTRADLDALPRDWAVTLRNWRGVYLIVDESDGARYVGSAYGNENLLGRWLTHVAGETGITVELARRNPARFRFSILELVSPTAPDVEVIACEATWKSRLDTRRFGLNGN